MRIYSMLDGEIYPGRLYQSARTHSLSLEKKAFLLSEFRITTVCNLWHTEDAEMRRLLEVLSGEADGHYIHHYIPDGKSALARPAELFALARRLADKLMAGEGVLVHCWGGRNRAGLVNALAAREILGISGRQAAALVRQKRPRALVNEDFVEFLEGLT